MIKGVTKNVIEINNMNSEYFEKAIIILKENCPVDENELRREAQLAIGDPPEFLKSLKNHVRIKMAICGVMGALGAALLQGALYLLLC